jgi:hypothetical protein
MVQRGAPKLVGRSKAANDAGVARRLWDVSEELTGVRFRLGAAAAVQLRSAVAGPVDSDDITRVARSSTPGTAPSSVCRRLADGSPQDPDVCSGRSCLHK